MHQSGEYGDHFETDVRVSRKECQKARRSVVWLPESASSLWNVRTEKA